ncbi:MAG: S9 family peptidase [Candidatus Heimdallarchaeota archaeon]|nr:S9 family peptidase [Candidatus Heimdallarchaeota archaeon]
MDKPNIDYPKVRKGSVVDEFHGVQVADPYRWMEDHRDPELVEWIAKQNQIFTEYIDQDFQKETVKDLEGLFDYTRYGLPKKSGDYYYYSKNTGLEKQSKEYRRKGIDGEEELILDPNTLSENATLAVVNKFFSKTGKYVALELSQSGSDWREVRLLNLETLEFEEDNLQNIRNAAGIQWLKDDSGFYYSAYIAREEEGSAKLWFHRLGEDQVKDDLVYEHPTDEKMLTYTSLDHTNKWMFITHSKDTMPRNLLYYRKLGDEEFIPIHEAYEFAFYPLGVHNDIAYVFTNEHALNGKVISIDLNNPAHENWKVVIKETDPINSVQLSKDRFIIIYNRNVKNEMEILDLTGNKLNKVEFPTFGTIMALGSVEHEEVSIFFSSFFYPTSIYHLNSQDFTLREFEKPAYEINEEDFIATQVMYPSKDGTMIPMYILHRKDLVKNGENPTVLYGYGGFNISLNPALNQFAIHWMNMGGVYAIANLRGGDEFGEKWHKAGYLFNKQNVFDDFHAAAEYLIREKYTNAKRLATRGGSNGGLLTAATMLQRPELYGAVLTLVGVLDMLRFHLYTIGRYWVPEYGDINDKDQFENMYKYSPLHNVREDMEYPPTYVYTADFDDRVDTAHSKKYTAILQEKAKGGPFVMRVQTDAGHNAIGKQITKIIEDMSFEIAFLKRALDF